MAALAENCASQINERSISDVRRPEELVKTAYQFEFLSFFCRVIDSF